MVSPAKVLAIGTATQDIFLEGFSPDLFVDGGQFGESMATFCLPLGSKNDIKKISIASGGGATNVAVALARQGLSVGFLGAVGDDQAGQAILAELDRENVDTSRVEFSHRFSTDCSIVILAENGERTILSHHGAASNLQLADFSIDEGEFDWIYVANLAGRLELLDRIFTEAKAKKAKIMWNPGKNELANLPKFKALLADVDILLVNRQEAQMVFSGQSNDELVRHAIGQVEVILLTDGSNGVWASDGRKIVRAGMYEDVESIDRTGAGDAFGSGFLAGWIKGFGLSDSIVLASANSTSVIQEIGAKAGLLDSGFELHSMPLKEDDL